MTSITNRSHSKTPVSMAWFPYQNCKSVTVLNTLTSTVETILTVTEPLQSLNFILIRDIYEVKY